MSLLILQMQHLAQAVLPLRHGGHLHIGVDGCGFGVEEHAGAEATGAVVALQDVVVLASLATLPKLLVLRQFGQCHRHVAECGVELHYGQRGRDTEELGIGKSLASQFERLLLDASGQAHLAVFGVNDKARGGHKVAVTPALDVAEPYETLAIEGYNSLAAIDLLGHIFRRALGYACATLQGRFVYQLADMLGIYDMLGVGISYDNIVCIHIGWNLLL